MERIYNDFTINIATANGTGSQSSNLILLNSMFQMGVPVSGKNLFPSNIAGLPTWFIIRASDDGYQAPGNKAHIQVLMNKDSWRKDLEKLEPGTLVVYNEDVKLPVDRDDCFAFGMPMTKMARGINPKLARLMCNMYYVGGLAHLLGIDEDMINECVSNQFKGKEKAIEFNLRAIGEGRAYAAENWADESPYHVESRDKDPDTFLVEGNEAVALGAIYGGINLLSWYPITPSSSMAESMIEWLPELREADDGGTTCAVIQAEDELAAAGMVVGAGWAGGRGMTCTSGPGISLMSEFIGLSYFAEVPSVIWDINRVGPSTGLPTRTQQGDLSMLYEASHGDTQHVVLIPGTVDECFEYGWKAFDYAERLQTVVFGFSDLDLGMNHWSTAGFEYPSTPMDRGKVLRTQKEMDAVANYGRYRDVDGDGIPYRTLPGSGLDPILYRGTGHDEDGIYSEDPDVYYATVSRLRRKIDGARDLLPAPLIREEEEQQIGVIYYGSMENSITEIDDMLESTGLSVSTCRVRALPYHSEVEGFIERHEKVIVLEINRDGQLYGILRKELPVHLLARLHSVAYTDGIPPRARVYADKILETLEVAA
ncbi:MAG: 2-oxoacid:acceptor oxidoreductase subunit alpha [Candidatus Thermoplasmatota archaeon]|uniref:2-oxoglutarate synthase subunit KorA n=1 Tax=uncultured marine group II/III euryarchaeote AD1000_04_B09 TaxID=1457704 RepID=A0A075FGT3_9EURY|nr:pyruvate flavodoxin/ferredoxin oxidoreductase domain-containing protein (korA) [uncultured marine group II/III euryarchaeote AD1000_04_B09]MEC7714018.1 2-oxoacid:acceptor oxidoreductase subunit alpha [Candidatus Thermoplasmatota archaeon]MED5159105.1 2-oxoacid:acceptor oxidoreductase subunit alpha [Candidatus Thermoplasmatota archaeon]MEE3318400.1 2-oxoacid:acceptor oxidoreductase subunit alpha [Candidatus Thermoplasmatota archaeon]|tara:strand:+ start:3846 stop:5630 length:1785 start_codon:yes stop_codon:yes gene_type:complete